MPLKYGNSAFKMSYMRASIEGKVPNKGIQVFNRYYSKDYIPPVKSYKSAVCSPILSPADHGRKHILFF